MASGETLEQLRARLAAVKQDVAQEEARTVQLINDVDQAAKRFHLQSEINRQERKLAKQQEANVYHAQFRRELDNRSTAPWLHKREGAPPEESSRGVKHGLATHLVTCGEDIDLSEHVTKKEFTWKIGGFSWLADTLKQEGSDYAESDLFVVYGDDFDLVYNPTGDVVGGEKDGMYPHGSLALRHLNETGITLKYSFFVKDPDGGEFVQWGEAGDECHPEWDDEPKAFGPDVQWVRDGAAPSRPIGIFGLSHAELLTSKWVQNDTLTVQVKFEVRAPKDICDIRDTWKEKARQIEVPNITLQQDFLSLYNTGRYADVTFVVAGVEKIQAHANVLCVRSEVFSRELASGMYESTSKEIKIDDTDTATFQAFLKFLYSDDLAVVEEDLLRTTREETAAENSGSSSSSAAKAVPANPSASVLLRLLSLCHRYQVTRLRLWCEDQLRKFVSVEEVCSILCKAYLYEAMELEKVCLHFIKRNMNQVVPTPGFTELTKHWPEVMLKLNAFLAGISGSQAQAIAEKGFERKKRPAEETEEKKEGGDESSKRPRT